MSIVAQKTFQSKFGFHPISKEYSKKLRFINGVYAKAQHVAGSWERWANKEEQNRVLKKSIRNDQNQVVEREIIGVWEEPKVCPLFHDTKSKVIYNWGFCRARALDNGIGQKIIEASRQARTPMPNEKDVLPFPFTEKEIDFLYDSAKNW